MWNEERPWYTPTFSFEESVAEIFTHPLITVLNVSMPEGTKQTQTISKPLK